MYILGQLISLLEFYFAQFENELNVDTNKDLVL
jgi:hypothetical protein